MDSDESHNIRNIRNIRARARGMDADGTKGHPKKGTLMEARSPHVRRRKPQVLHLRARTRGKSDQTDA